jgi:hypothetical protein
VPPALVGSTVKAATLVAAGHAAALGAISANAAALTEGAVQAMFWTKLKVATATLLALALLVPGAGWLAHRALAERPAPGKERPAAEPAKKDERARAPREEKAPPVAGRVVGVSKDGKTITLELPVQARGEEPKKVEVKIGEKTTVLFNGVGPDGAKPTTGHSARAWLDNNAKEAANIVFHGLADARGRRPHVSGKVVGLSKDGRTLNVEVPSRRPREEEPKKMELKLGAKTTIAFHNVGLQGARIAEGLEVQVWYEEGSKDRPEVVSFSGTERVGRRDVAPGAAGRVVGVSKDGKTITLEAQERGRREGGKKIDIKLGPKTAMSFHNVPLGGAKLAEGLAAAVWLEEGSKDTAGSVRFIGTIPERGQLVAGRVAGVSKDGKTITLEQPARARGEEPKKIEVKIGAKTRVVYYGVGPGGARPSEGYAAQARVEEGTTLEVRFIKPGSGDRRR